MTGDELQHQLAELGIGHAEFARLIGVTRRAVGLWVAGDRSVPGPVAAYLHLLARLPLGMRLAEVLRLSQEVQLMKDGMYLVYFSANDGRGACVLIFDGGRVYGADTETAKYDGECAYNEDTGLMDLALKVQMPANTRSVIGVEYPFDWILEASASLDPKRDEDQITVQTNVGVPIAASYKFLRELPLAA